MADLETAAAILLRVSETMMPEYAACGHDRRWLLSLLDDLRAALAPAPSEPEPPALDAIRKALDIGRVSFDGDGWFATGAVEDGAAGLGTYDECEAAFQAAYAALARLTPTSEKAEPR